MIDKTYMIRHIFIGTFKDGVTANAYFDRSTFVSAQFEYE